MNMGRGLAIPRVFETLQMTPLACSDRAYVSEMLRLYPPTMSEYTFSNLFAWNDPQRWIGTYKNHLLVGREECNQIWFLQPIGREPASVIRELSAYEDVHWERIDAHVATHCADVLSTHSLREHFDYVYERQNLVDMGGSGLKIYRKQIRHFVKEYNPTVRALTAEDLDDCRHLVQRWSEARPLDESGIKELIALNSALDNLEAWSLHNLGVFLSSQLEAFVLGESLNSDTFVIHYTKTGVPVRGLAPYLINQIATQVDARFDYVNSMQDLGLPGLRSVKMQWQPCHMVEKFRLSPWPRC